MKKYQTIFILDDSKSPDSGKGFIENLKTTVEETGGNVLETEEMGYRQFAHPIKKKAGGIYLDITIDLPVDKVGEFKERYRLDSSVLRLELFCFDRPAKSILKTEEVKETEEEGQEKVSGD